MRTGKCYCGDIEYQVDGDPMLKGQCLCRECQYISGGGANFFMVMPEAGFKYTKGTPAQFTRSDIDQARTRDFCPNCGTHILTRRATGGVVILKIGTLDDPQADYGGPQTAIFTIDRQPWHIVAEGLPCFERMPQS
ncbi:MAG: GFA family protein [Paracoccaceae bacterium]